MLKDSFQTSDYLKRVSFDDVPNMFIVILRKILDLKDSHKLSELNLEIGYLTKQID